jgi:hypothetical protein
LPSPPTPLPEKKKRVIYLPRIKKNGIIILASTPSVRKFGFKTLGMMFLLYSGS